ncbi:hypothetical protein LTR85_006557 [Meristemomyces frigidus]|nr:hypothetical protein LTR85_006557 [Meristemomyces frigidus]
MAWGLGFRRTLFYGAGIALQFVIYWLLTSHAEWFRIPFEPGPPHPPPVQAVPPTRPQGSGSDPDCDRQTHDMFDHDMHAPTCVSYLGPATRTTTTMTHYVTETKTLTTESTGRSEPATCESLITVRRTRTKTVDPDSGDVIAEAPHIDIEAEKCWTCPSTVGSDALDDTRDAAADGRQVAPRRTCLKLTPEHSPDSGGSEVAVASPPSTSVEDDDPSGVPVVTAYLAETTVSLAPRATQDDSLDGRVATVYTAETTVYHTDPNREL